MDACIDRVNNAGADAGGDRRLGRSGFKTTLTVTGLDFNGYLHVDCD